MRVRLRAPGFAGSFSHPATIGDAGPIGAPEPVPSQDQVDANTKTSDLAMLLSIVSSIALLLRGAA